MQVHRGQQVVLVNEKSTRTGHVLPSSWRQARPSRLAIELIALAGLCDPVVDTHIHTRVMDLARNFVTVCARY